ncbi:MAG: hypothetical protein HN350_17905, partial [Phycisphaerales bacterium]|nr:hypothetical protein [Phycisphaerales bacterium]
IAKVLGAILPNLTSFYMLDAITQNKPIPNTYFATALGYCVLYSGAVLSLGIAMFQTRPLEAQGGSSSMPALVGVLAWLGRAGSAACVITGGVLLSLSQYHTAGGFSLAAALLVGGIVGWMIWGLFGRGAKWTYLLAVIADVAVLISSGLILSGLWTPGDDQESGAWVMRAVVSAAAAAGVLLIMLLPRTRCHFNTESL